MALTPPATTTPVLLSALPAFVVADVAVAVAHYRDVLGFHVPPEWEKPGDFAIVDLAPGEGIHLRRGAPAGPDARLPGAYVRTSLDDLAARHAAMLARGAPVDGPPVDQRWGMREFSVRDLDGHLLRFAAELDGVLRGGRVRLCPEIPARDASAAVTFCRDRLGFSLEGGDGDLPYFGRVARDHAHLHWHTVRPVPAPNATRAAIWDVCIEVTRVDALAESLRARAAEIRRGPVTASYGMRELEVVGPEDRIFCFAEDVGAG